MLLNNSDVVEDFLRDLIAYDDALAIQIVWYDEELEICLDIVERT